MVLKDGSLVNDDKLKQEGALGVIHLDDHNVQVVIGTKVASVRDRLEDYLA